MKRILFVLFALTLATAPVFSQETSAPAAAPANKSDLPSVTIKSLDGKSVNTNTFGNDGKPFIIDFWATWCKPCVTELNAIHDNFVDWQEETGIKVYAISIDDSRTMGSVAPFVSGRGWAFDIYLDPNSDFRRAMNVNNVPHTFLFDGKGKIVSQHNTYNPGDEEKLYAEILKLIGK
jgi:cytochrome c biogenesis protein CcmG, thiol:disulfide interchange protein DsbE